ncbi:MAG: helix-turn-helix domain-containing protein [Nevskia sp.]|nr:helix-turn-helix domain-containing protein [Nevskia sp.]
MGDHIRQRRNVLGLSQRKAAPLLGVDRATVWRWEVTGFDPEPRFLPTINAFLGYDPYPPPVGYPDRLLAIRRKKGWNVLQAAARLGADYKTWVRWEQGVTAPRGVLKKLVESLLAEP